MHGYLRQLQIKLDGNAVAHDAIKPFVDEMIFGKKKKC